MKIKLYFTLKWNKIWGLKTSSMETCWHFGPMKNYWHFGPMKNYWHFGPMVTYWHNGPMETYWHFCPKKLPTFWSNRKLLTFWSNGNLLTFWSSLFRSHVDNHFCDIFFHLCHVGFFINGNEQKLTNEWIYSTFFTFGD